MAKPRLILDNEAIDLIISRFALQIMEDQNDDDVLAIIGLQPRGVELSRRIFARAKEFFPKNDLLYGELDITFHRDDVGRGEQILVPKETHLNFSTENIKIILVDDVLYTGRSVRAGLDAIVNFGRPKQVELMTLIDRRYNRELPICPDYVGATVDSRSTGEKVKVDWIDNDNKVWLIERVKK